MIEIKDAACTIIIALAICKASAQGNVARDIELIISTEQRSIVSTLSGALTVDDGKTLFRRWTDEEKKLARKYLQAKFADVGVEAKEHAYKVSLPHVKASRNPLRGINLFAEIPASIESTEYIIIGAHYDTVSESPGAMDNATGCALAYGVAKLVTAISVRKKNLIVVFFDQEETGHAGSYAFANYIKVIGHDVHSVHTFDMIGWDNDGDKNIELELPAQELESLYRKHAQSRGVVAHTTETSVSDHREFRDAGFSAIGIGGEYIHGDTSPHHHLPTDTVDTVNFEYLAFVTLLVYTAIEELITD